jgi:hypothetical protein
VKFEPVALTELIRQGVLLLVAFGVVHWSDQQTAVLLMFVSGLLAYIARASVTPNATIEASDTTVREVKAQAKANSTIVLLPFVLLVALGSSGCASLGGPRHIASVSVVTAHSVLSAVQDTTRALYCGAPTAPPAPACIDDERRRTIASNLVTAFDLDAQVARTVRAAPADGTLPTGIADLVGQITALVERVLALIPKSPQRGSLVAQIGGQ